jgi:hypothetical protein
LTVTSIGSLTSLVADIAARGRQRSDDRGRSDARERTER